MKRILPLILIIFVFNSCKSSWDQDDKDAFYQACTEEAMKTGDTKEQAKAYCDCVFSKMTTKYPSEEEALGHMDELAKDTDLIKCKQEVLGK